MATKSEFRDFVKRQRKQVEEERWEVDWHQRREKWLVDLNALYDSVKNFLEEYASEGALEYRFDEVEIHEDNIGLYKAPRMLIQIGSTVVTLTPVGTIIFGAYGRVDLDGRAGKVRLVLVESSAPRRPSDVRILEPGEIAPAEGASGEEQLAWKIATAPPQAELHDLTPERFYDAVLEVANA